MKGDIPRLCWSNTKNRCDERTMRYKASDKSGDGRVDDETKECWAKDVPAVQYNGKGSYWRHDKCICWQGPTGQGLYGFVCMTQCASRPLQEGVGDKCPPS